MGSSVRRWRRSGAELLGHIYVVGGETVKCAVSNLSASGAALRTDVPLPPEFDLEIPKLNKVFRVALHWKNKDEAGVHFVLAPIAAAADVTGR
jgi:hypothetical protein